MHGATVAFSGDGITVNSTTVVSSNQIDVSVSIDDAATVGNRDVMITNPDTGVDIEDSAFTVELRPTITSVTLANGVGTPGVIEAGDTIAIQFSKQMRETSICSLWTGGDNANPTINADGDVTVVANNGGARQRQDHHHEQRRLQRCRHQREPRHDRPRRPRLRHGTTGDLRRWRRQH